MKIEIYKCNYCGKEIKGAYLNERGWIHIDKDGLSVSGGKAGGHKGVLARLSVSVVVPEIDAGMLDFYDVNTEPLDFCCLGCFVKWLFLSEETECSKDVDKVSLLKEAIRSLLNDKDLKEIIIDCLKSENL